MRILLNTVCFYPHIGGLETMNMLIANSLSQMGHQVVVIAPNYNEEYDDSIYSFKIIRSASAITLLREYIKCDIFFHRQLSLKAIWPKFIWPFKPFVSSYHMCEFYTGSTPGLASSIKYAISRFTNNITVSKSVAKYLKMKNATVIYNAYNSDLFVDQQLTNRTGFIYVGRLASVKGIDILLDAFAALCKKNLDNKHMHLTIVGGGDEKNILIEKVSQLGLGNRICFKGSMKGQELVDEMNKHFCQVIPSRYREAFGIVALEAMATGCIPIVSDGDGLEEACGGIGISFQKGNHVDLAQKMEYVLALSNEEVASIKDKAKAWCSEYTPIKVAKRYEEVLNKIIN